MALLVVDQNLEAAIVLVERFAAHRLPGSLLDTNQTVPNILEADRVVAGFRRQIWELLSTLLTRLSNWCAGPAFGGADVLPCPVRALLRAADTRTTRQGKA